MYYQYFIRTIFPENVTGDSKGRSGGTALETIREDYSRKLKSLLPPSPTVTDQTSDADAEEYERGGFGDGVLKVKAQLCYRRWILIYSVSY